ncbi:hypothetical protein TcG_11429 [Trypanosoma cruzi]|nr:hypothetical protein TcG_11429 [Trypanosoma cruzi]
MLSACGAPVAPNIHTCLRLTVAPSSVRWLHQGCRHPETGIRTLHPTKPSETPAGPTTTVTAGCAAFRRSPQIALRRLLEQQQQHKYTGPLGALTSHCRKTTVPRCYKTRIALTGHFGKPCRILPHYAETHPSCMWPPQPNESGPNTIQIKFPFPHAIPSFHAP